MASEYRRFYPPSITQEEVDRLRRIEEDYHYKVNQVAKLERKLADKSPGSPLGRLSAIAVYAEENCGWSPIEARPPECAIRDRVEDLERQLSEAIARIAVEVEDNARDAAYIVKLEQQLVEAKDYGFAAGLKANLVLKQEQISELERQLAEARKDKADLLEAIRRVLRKLQRDGVAPGWGVVKDWLNQAAHSVRDDSTQGSSAMAEEEKG